MGGCSCHSNSDVVSRAGLQRALVEAIEANDLISLEELHQRFFHHGSSVYVLPELTFEDCIITLQGMELTPLAYAFKLGREEIAAYLIEKVGCSVSRLYSFYKSWGKSPLYILCDSGHSSLLSYFLPLCVESFSPKPQSPLSFDSSDLSLFMEKPSSRTPNIPIYPLPHSPTPAHRACEKGHLEAIKILWEHGRKCGVFRDIDLKYIDERTGENSALLASKAGHIHVMKYLYQVCRVDFHLKNKRKEGALQLTLLGAKHKPSTRYVECVKYLVETVKVDLLYEYEETLLLVEDKCIQDYLELRLQRLGVSQTKAKVEETYAIGQSHFTACEQDRFLCSFGAEFRLSEVFREELQDSQPSSILPNSDQSPVSLSSALA